MDSKHLLVFRIFILITISLSLSFLISQLLINQLYSKGNENAELSNFGGPAPIELIAEKLTMEQLISRLKENNASLSLPIWMPGNLEISMIYYKPPVVVVVYSDRGVTDYRYANASIEISLWDYNPPTVEELKQASSANNNIKVVNVNGEWISISENVHRGFPGLQAPYNTGTIAEFIHSDSHDYMVTVLPPLTTQDLINIIESMQTLP